MCTARFSDHHGSGEGGQCLPRGCLPRGHVWPGRCVQGCLSRGVYTPWTQRQTPPILHAGIHTPCPCILGYNLPPPWTEGMTHACENITLPQTSLAGVITLFSMYPKHVSFLLSGGCCLPSMHHRSHVQGEVCIQGGLPTPRALKDMVNKWVVSILLECILVRQ